MKWLNLLLVFIPIGVALELAHASAGLVFAASCLAIIPLASLIGNATEELARYLGPAWGGLLNATFGNATELIIATFALRAGLLAVVKASITGSIIGNLLLVVGLAVLAGGLRHKTQTFNKHMAGLHSSMLLMSVLALMVPAAFVHAVPGLYERSLIPSPARSVESLSMGVAAVLIAVYLLSLYFSLRTHESLFSDSGGHDAGKPRMRLGMAVWLLVLSSVAIAVMSELLVGSIEPVTETLHLSQMFVGVVVVAVIGNAAEHASAVLFARRNQMDVALNISIGSSTQVALFVAPVLVFISAALGHPMTLIFNPFELVSIAFAVAIVTIIALDGQSHWMEGVLLLAAYTVIAMAFYFIPPEKPAPARHSRAVWEIGGRVPRSSGTIEALHASRFDRARRGTSGTL